MRKRKRKNLCLTSNARARLELRIDVLGRDGPLHLYLDLYYSKFARLYLHWHETLLMSKLGTALGGRSRLHDFGWFIATQE